MIIFSNEISVLEIKYRLTFTGGIADKHRLPAHDGAQSLEAIAWSFSLLGHYLATGKIKSRGNLDDRIRFELSAPRRGSYATDLFLFVTNPDNIYLTSVIGVYAANTVSTVINSFIVYSFKRVTGTWEYENDDGLDKFLKKIPSGEREANIASIEPSVKRAHSVIDRGASLLDVSYKRNPQFTFDLDTKNYVNSDVIDKQTKLKTVSIGGFYANSGNGSAYIPSEGRTVRFRVDKQPEERTHARLSESLLNYTKSLPSYIDIICREVHSNDGRLKRLLIYGARPHMGSIILP